jgi:hypothetical protein
MNENAIPGWGVVVIGFSGLVVSNLVSAYANIQLKRDAMIRSAPVGLDGTSRKYLVYGVILSILAGIMDIGVTGIIPLAFRACSAPLSIPTNVLVARWALRERVGHRRALGIALTFIGCIESVLSMSRPDEGPTQVTASSVHWVPTICLLGFGLGLVVADLLSIFHRFPFRVLSIFSSACGVSFIAGCSTTLGKLGSLSALSYTGLVPLLLFIIGCVTAAVAQILLTSRMLGKFEISTCMPAYQILTMAWLSIFSYIVFGEETSNGVGFLGGFLTSAVGVWIVAEEEPTEPILVIEDTTLIKR